MTIKNKLSDRDRNQLCPCGSGLRQKFCHNDPIKLQQCNRIAQLYMVKLIVEERKKRGLEPYNFTCEKCGKGTDRPVQSKLAQHVLLCPDEDCSGAVKERAKPTANLPSVGLPKSTIILES